MTPTRFRADHVRSGIGGMQHGAYQVRSNRLPTSRVFVLVFVTSFFVSCFHFFDLRFLPVGPGVFLSFDFGAWGGGGRLLRTTARFILSCRAFVCACAFVAACRSLCTYGGSGCSLTRPAGSLIPAQLSAFRRFSTLTGGRCSGKSWVFRPVSLLTPPRGGPGKGLVSQASGCRPRRGDRREMA